MNKMCLTTGFVCYASGSLRQYTGCFTTLGHNCRRWFPRSLSW